MDDILRMRASIVTDEALANLRGLAKELGMVGRRVDTSGARRQIGALRTDLSSVGQAIRSQVVPALSMFGFATGGVGASLAAMAIGTKNYANDVNSLARQARGLGLSAREVRAFTLASERLGIGASEAGSALSTLRTNIYDFQRGLNIEGATQQLREMGQGDLVNALKTAKSMSEAIGLVTQRLEFLSKVDPERARRVAEAIYGIGAAARLTAAELTDAASKVRDLTEDQRKAADEFSKSFTGMSAAWKRFSETGFENAEGKLTVLMDLTTKLFGLFERMGQTPGSSPGAVTPLPGYEGWGKTEGEFGRRTFPRLRDGYRPMSFGGSDGSTESVLAEGVFQGLLRFSQYQGSGSGGGMMNAALRTGSDAFPGTSEFPRIGGDSGAARAMAGSGGTRGDRNNNPGNLKFGPLARSFGATGADDRGFAIFPNRLSGEEAQNALVKSDRYKGLTLDQFGAKYAEGSSDWKRTVGAALGIRGGDIVNNQDPRLIGAIRRAEGTGGAPTIGGALSSSAGGSVPADVMQGAERLLRQGGSSAQLQQYMSAAGYPKSGAWCGQFAASVIKSAGGTPPKGAAIASNWLNWGERVDPADARPGDIGVRKFSRYGGRAVPGQTGSHVGIVKEGVDPATGRFGLMGGNQGAPVSSNRASQYEFRRAPSLLDREMSGRSAQGMTANGKVDITVNNGSKVEAKSSGELFQETRIVNLKQMTPPPTGGGGHPDGGF